MCYGRTTLGSHVLGRGTRWGNPLEEAGPKEGGRPFLNASYFRECAFPNCLEIRSGSRIGATKAAKRGRRSLDRPNPPAKEGRSRRLQLFSKQFLQELRRRKSELHTSGVERGKLGSSGPRERQTLNDPRDLTEETTAQTGFYTHRGLDGQASSIRPGGVNS